MDTNLVGPASLWAKFDPCLTVRSAKHPPFRDGGLTGWINDHPPAFFFAADLQKRRVYSARIVRWSAFNDRPIGFLGQAFLK